MDSYKGTINWIIGTSLQWIKCLEIIDTDQFISYLILPEGAEISMIKIDGLLNIPRNFD